MFFNISHASLIAFVESCEHEHVEVTHLELEQEEACDDLCDIHHLFHFSAIIIEQKIVLNEEKKYLPPETKHTFLPPLHKQSTIKPPIA
jgi:hypothetical protein